MQRFVEYDDVEEILSQGRHGLACCCAAVASGLQSGSKESYGAALHYFTGGKAHNIAIRRLGQERDLRSTNTAYFGATSASRATRRIGFRLCRTALYSAELREDQGEIEAAKAGYLPQLVRVVGSQRRSPCTYQGVGRSQHDSGNGSSCKSHGLQYLAITEHSRRLTVAHGLDPVRLLKQIDEIDKLNETLDGIVLLKGIEVDILEDGSLDLPDDVLGRLDIVVGAVHSRFGLSRIKQTERILRAMDRPYFNVLAHPSGRLIGRREPYEVDMLRVIRKARARVFLELNANPERLDLVDSHCRMARRKVFGQSESDAQRSRFRNLRYAVGQARRGWLECGDVLEFPQPRRNCVRCFVVPVDMHSRGIAVAR